MLIATCSSYVGIQIRRAHSSRGCCRTCSSPHRAVQWPEVIWSFTRNSDSTRRKASLLGVSGLLASVVDLTIFAVTYRAPRSVDRSALCGDGDILSTRRGHRVAEASSQSPSRYRYLGNVYMNRQSSSSVSHLYVKSQNGMRPWYTRPCGVRHWCAAKLPVFVR